MYRHCHWQRNLIAVTVLPLPTFLIIGAMKSGTSALYTYLDQHPEVYMSPVKEPNFFAFEGDTLDFQAPIDDRGINAQSITDLEQYETLFADGAGFRARGEASHWYLYWPKAPMRIQHHIPDARLVAILRNPVERAYSEYLHFVRDGSEPYDDFGAALDAEGERMQNNWAMGRYVDRGFYHRQLARYFARFDREQLKIYLHDDLKADSEAVMQDLYEFIGVDPAFTPDVSVRPNPSGVPQNKWMHMLLHPSGPLQKRLIQKLPQWLRDIGRSLRNQNLDKPELRSEHRRRLIETYREDILQLEDLLDRDLSGWLTA